MTTTAAERYNRKLHKVFDDAREHAATEFPHLKRCCAWVVWNIPPNGRQTETCPDCNTKLTHVNGEWCDDEQRKLLESLPNPTEPICTTPFPTSNPLSALTPAQLAAIRSVILEVIDDGDIPCEFYDVSEAYANNQRLDFCDEIQRRIVQRGAPATVRGTHVD